jgi:hypothetical protein
MADGGLGVGGCLAMWFSCLAARAEGKEIVMIAGQEYLTLTQVAEQLPRGRTGKLVYSSTIARWITIGVRITGGKRVMLRGVRLPGGWRTTQDWVDEFLDGLTRAPIEDANRPAPDPMEPAMRRFEIEQEQRTLTAMGL